MLPRRLPSRILAACGVLASLATVPGALHAADYQWDSVAIGGGGFVSALIPSQTEPGLLYARTDVGGAYRWDASASRWTPLNDWTRREDVGFLGVESLATDPQRPNRLYLLVGIVYFSNGRSAILRSDDYGETFEVIDVTAQFRAHGNGMGRQNGEKLQVDPHNSELLYCGTREQGLFKSLDRGSTWSRLDALDVTTTPTGNGVSFVALDPASEADGASQTLYVGLSRASDNLYRSTDAGASFALVPGAPSGLMPQRGAIAPDGSLLVTYGNGAGPHPIDSFDYDQGAVWKLDAQDGAWSDLTPAGYDNPYGGISVDPEDPQRLLASSTNLWWPQGEGAFGDRFFLSTDGGASWTDLVERGFALDSSGIPWIEDQSIHWAGSIVFDPFDTHVAWVTSGNGVYRCDDLSATPTVWKFAVRGIEETVPLDLVSIPDGPLVSVIGDFDGFRHADPKRYAPPHRPSIGTTTGVAYAAADPQHVYRVGDSMQRSSDGARTWTATETMNGRKGAIALSADGEILLHSPENSSATYRSADQGASWTAVSGLSIQDARPVADPVNPDVFYAYGGSSLHRSTDGGASFAPAASLPSGGFKRLATAPGREGQLWFAHPSQGLFHSADAGDTFAPLPGVAAARAVGTGKPAPKADGPTLFIWGTVDGVEGVHRSTDQGATWLRVNDNAHQYGGPGNGQFVVGDQNVFGRVYLSTAGRGIAFGEPMLDSIAYGEWSQRVFAEAQLADSEVVGEAADPDDDGLANLLEWILQTDPLQPTRLAEHTFAFSASAPSIAFEQLADLSSATLSVEISTDLQSWSDIAALFTEEPSEPADNSPVPTRARVFRPANGAFPPTLFLRFGASR